jgi:DNA helicase-2/ATP-dependent DNA helicase PcrA
MSGRGNQRDTAADRMLYECLSASPPISFLMVAGAGAGKTTSLIKCLNEAVRLHGRKMKRRRQRIACVTYTEVAAQEIRRDVGNESLVAVGTIHSFLWNLIQPFQSDIQKWVADRIASKLCELEDEARNFSSRVGQRKRDMNAAETKRYREAKGQIGGVRSFLYKTGSDYSNGILGHDDIIKMVPQLILERSLLRQLVAHRFPIIFVDESQDTFKDVVACLKAIQHDFGGWFSLGFFGDPMQRIYSTGVGPILPEEGWRKIEKEENFRCPEAVLNVANAVRSGGDGLVQRLGKRWADPAVNQCGTANLFVLPSDEHRDRRLLQIRSWAAERTADSLWRTEQVSGVKVLVISHWMAAKRLGFSDLYAAMNDKAPTHFKEGLLDGTAWPLKPFVRFILPLVSAINKRNEFESIQILRDQSPKFSVENVAGSVVSDLLLELRRVTRKLASMMEPGANSSVAEVLLFVRDSGIVELDKRILDYLPQFEERLQGVPRDEAQVNTNDDDVTKEVSAMDALLACDASQFWGYYRYLSDEAPFSTQHGIKGAEFDRVLVVLDDEEGRHKQFSYEKYFGLRELSDADNVNLAGGKETVIERTRRLFYVCCTRALKDLVVVLFCKDASAAIKRISTLDLFPPEAIHGEDVLGAFRFCGCSSGACKGVR